MDIIKVVLKNYDPKEFDNSEGAMFVTTATCFQKNDGTHRKGLKKVGEEYFVELEKREKAEAKRRSIQKKRMINNEILKTRLAEIRDESEALK